MEVGAVLLYSFVLILHEKDVPSKDTVHVSGVSRRRWGCYGVVCNKGSAEKAACLLAGETSGLSHRGGDFVARLAGKGIAA